MSNYRIKLDKQRCIACHACEVHCKAKNNVPVGVTFNHIFITGPVADKNGLPRYEAKYQPCFHCKKPECAPACPVEAISIRESDGLVLIDAETCIGCQACIEACPWSVPVFYEDENKVFKCDFCRDRIDEGLDPACVQGCTAHALEFVRK